MHHLDSGHKAGIEPDYVKGRRLPVRIVHLVKGIPDIGKAETGIKYEEAVDVEDAPYTYEATEERIEHEEDEEELTIQ